MAIIELFLNNKKKKVFIIFTLLVFLVLVALCDYFLREFIGLGNPVLYDSSPLYGYRPLPNKEYTRHWGAKIKINNIGLRAESNWESNKNNKILFLGDSVTYGGSYIDNKDLFSQLVVDILNKDYKLSYKSGNAGVNAWGVENIYGLIVESDFLPASIYVTILPEGDFYRGLTRMQGTPFFCNKPGSALLELWYFFCYKQNNHRYSNWILFSDEHKKTVVVEKAVKKLKEMDIYLKKKGYQHIIIISPSKSQVLQKKFKDTLVNKLFVKHQLETHYIIDEINEYYLPSIEIDKIFHDDIHLEKKGHELWAKIIVNILKLQLPFSKEIDKT